MIPEKSEFASGNATPRPLHPEFPLLAADRPLEALAADINQAHAEAHAYASKAVERALQAGDLLIQAKARVAHGEWLPWLAANCPEISTRRTQEYMKLSREWPAIEAKYAESAYLTIDGALRLLVTADTEAALPPPTPPPTLAMVKDLLAALPKPEQQAAIAAVAPDAIKVARDGEREALWSRAQVGYLATILRDMKKSFRTTTAKFTRFCELALLIPEPITALLLDDNDIYQQLARDTVRYELTYGAWDGFYDLCTVIHGLLTDAYGDAETEATQ